MKRTLIILFTFFILSSKAQTNLEENFKQLYNNKKYDKIIDYKPKKNEEITAIALYYIGLSHYMKSEDDAAMKYLDKAIKKGPIYHDMYYYKAMLLYYSKKYNEALPYYSKAIAMLPNEPDFFIGKAETYYALDNLDSTIFYFEKATQLPKCNYSAFVFLGEIYQDKNNIEKAYSAYKSAFEQLMPSDKSYQNCSFNLGLMEQLTNRLYDAKTTFENHVAIFPTDYQAIGKLIQIYYSLSEFDKAIPYKQKLYVAYKTHQLPTSMKEMFCFDQFMWNKKRIMAFENFDDSNEILSVKQHFFVTDNFGKTEYRVDLETSAAIRMSNPKNKYVLCLVKDNAHFTYWQYIFDDNYLYTELKSALLDILNEKIKPSGAFFPNKTK